MFNYAVLSASWLNLAHVIISQICQLIITHCKGIGSEVTAELAHVIICVRFAYHVIITHCKGLVQRSLQGWLM
jgi:hypothetical protein